MLLRRILSNMGMEASILKILKSRPQSIFISKGLRGRKVPLLVHCGSIDQESGIYGARRLPMESCLQGPNSRSRGGS
jgi:hypothetical protein